MTATSGAAVGVAAVGGAAVFTANISGKFCAGCHEDPSVDISLRLLICARLARC